MIDTRKVHPVMSEIPMDAFDSEFSKPCSAVPVLRIRGGRRTRIPSTDDLDMNGHVNSKYLDWV